MILLEPPLRADGEMNVVKYYLTTEEGRYTSLLDLFDSLLRSISAR